MTIASEITRLQGAKADIKTAIENKGVTVPSVDTIDQYAGYIDQIETGTTIVNGVIENYLASTSTVDAGTFVEFVGSWGTKTEISSDSNSTKGFSAVALDDTRVFVAYSGAGYRRLYGVVCTLSGESITTGTVTQIVSGSNNSEHISTCLIGENKVFVAYSSSNTSSLSSIVCTASGATITVGTSTQIVSASNASLSISAIALEADKVFLAHSYGSTPYIYGIICNISDYTITKGTDTSLESSHAGYSLNACKMSGDKVVVVGVAQPSYGSAPVYGVACTISGTTITAGTLTAISNNYVQCGYSLSAVGIDNTRVAVVFGGDGAYYLYGTICYVSGSRTLNKTTDTMLSSQNDNGKYSFVSRTRAGIMVLYSSYTNYRLNVMTGIVNGKALAVDGTTTVELSNTSNSAIDAKALNVGENSLILYPETSYTLNGIVQQLKIQTSTDRIDGFTKTEATTSTPGEVWVLNS